MSETILTVTGARRAYVKDKAAVDGVDLVLKRGEITALLGPSGCGKSTLLKSIAGLERLDAGEIRAADGALWSGGGTHLPPEARRIGMVFQDYALFPHLDALRNVAFGLKGADRLDRARAALEGIELADKARAYPHELSGGEQQRVALARALAPQPDLVLLDEPFSGLDRRLRGELRETTLAALKAAGTAALFVTHDAEEAMAGSDRLALMRGGKLIQDGAPEAVYLNPVSADAARLLGDVNVWEGAAKGGLLETPVGPVQTDAPDGARAQALIRPEAVSLASAQGATLTVEAVRSLGADVMVFVRDGDGMLWRTRMRAPTRLEAGAQVATALNSAFIRAVSPA
jgi:iron(III) transport system ATP-binding protein